MTYRTWLAAGCGAIMLGGCVSTPAPVPNRVPMATTPPVYSTAGLERVIGQDARGLGALFGKPDLDVREDAARKLQFASGICVLDAYLYPPAPGREPLVTYVDARQPNGADIDRASCVAALVRRQGGR
ncbi:MAG: hypothetical protein ABS87_04490 [Sphingomonas sp. SCN 67-18]|uniref:hypothetical protein n=1 Tax=uncultured Sphingomonas sp. TaxID=158754 RepID=UPI00086CA3C9|nr:hypothetical protein [Sphingomonas sp. SCN 67-18]ODU21968.1 MAG: hypothetical protein ABS87_04490 [Sphingomonas sp. SCN 67-18]